tara:strand:+ start:83 stop:565 length:483 start_codon:yes stop_codon:yes gene_type:complete
MKKVLIGGILIMMGFLGVLSFIPLGIEPITEVYFENHTTLPSYLFLTQTTEFTFTINNLEEQNMSYIYLIEVYNEEGEMISLLNSNKFFLANGDSSTFTENLGFDDVFSITRKVAKINVKVTKLTSDEKPWFKGLLWRENYNYPSEINIHFWVEEIVPGV